MSKHPMQPVVVASDRVIRFQENKIVKWMLDQLAGQKITLNEVAMTAITFDAQDDYQQLMQLIGYSVSGYGDLSMHDPKILEKADAAAARLVARRKE